MFDLHALYCIARQMEKICERHAPERFAQVVEEALVERAREQIRYHSDDCWRDDEDVFQVLRGFVAGQETHWSVQAVAPEIEGDEARELLSDDTPCVAACGRVEVYVEDGTDDVIRPEHITCRACLRLLHTVALERRAPKWVKELVS